VFEVNIHKEMEEIHKPSIPKLMVPLLEPFRKDQSVKKTADFLHFHIQDI
jgi:hypothetical protein